MDYSRLVADAPVIVLWLTLVCFSIVSLVHYLDEGKYGN
jgi:hypothetical protein